MHALCVRVAFRLLSTGNEKKKYTKTEQNSKCLTTTLMGIRCETNWKRRRRDVAFNSFFFFLARRPQYNATAAATCTKASADRRRVSLPFSAHTYTHTHTHTYHVFTYPGTWSNIVTSSCTSMQCIRASSLSFTSAVGYTLYYCTYHTYALSVFLISAPQQQQQQQKKRRRKKTLSASILYAHSRAPHLLLSRSISRRLTRASTCAHVNDKLLLLL